MSKARLRRHAPTLGYLANCDKHTAKSIITNAKPQLLHCISDVCYNVLKGNVPLSSKEKHKLQKYKSGMRKIADRKTTLKARKVLIQKGGFLGALLTPLLGSVIAPLAQSLFGAK